MVDFNFKRTELEPEFIPYRITIDVKTQEQQDVMRTLINLARVGTSLPEYAKAFDGMWGIITTTDKGEDDGA